MSFGADEHHIETFPGYQRWGERELVLTSRRLIFKKKDSLEQAYLRDIDSVSVVRVWVESRSDPIGFPIWLVRIMHRTRPSDNSVQLHCESEEEARRIKDVIAEAVVRYG